MNALLVLLGLFVVATVAARPGAFSLVLDRAALPAWGLVGVLCAPPLLGLVPLWVLADLRPALLVSVAFLAVLSGLADAPLDGRHLLTSLFWCAAMTVLGAVVLGAIFSVDAVVAGSPAAVVHAAVFADHRVAFAALLAAGFAGSVVSPTQTQGALATALGAAFALAWIAWPVPQAALAGGPFALVALTGGGLAAALVVRLCAGSGAQAIVVAIGVVTLVAGAAARLHLPGAVAALVLGLALRPLPATRALVGPLVPLRRPIFAVVAFAAGVDVASAGVDRAVVVAGVVIAVAHVLARALAARVVGASLAAYSAGLSTSPLALALWASVAWATPAAAVDNGAVAVAATLLPLGFVAVVVSDALAALLTLAASRQPERP